MSLVHSTIVGHFEPATLTAANRQTIRQLDLAAARELLAEYPSEVSEHVEFREGYAECWWANRSFQVLDAVFEYAYRLAREQGCVAAETPVCFIKFPEDAKQVQMAAWREWSDRHPATERRSVVSPTSSEHQTEPALCLYCSEWLRTPRARQCRFCKMDWHDPENVYLRD